VPPGFVITTEIFRCWPVVSSFYMARNEFMKQLRHALNEIEEKTGTRYGDPDNPLLVSVRSGASISMPGMMATIHNVGLNNELVEAVAEVPGKEYLAWDNFRRFLQSWGMTTGVPRDTFQALMNEAKARYGVTVKSQFSPAQMKELALSYQKKIRNLGIGIPDDPWLQLTGAIEMVLASWDTPKTKGYRGLMGISHAWGTAAIVQAMVFGNLGPESGSGVVFTAHPYRSGVTMRRGTRARILSAAWSPPFPFPWSRRKLTAGRWISPWKNGRRMCIRDCSPLPVTWCMKRSGTRRKSSLPLKDRGPRISISCRPGT